MKILVIGCKGFIGRTRMIILRAPAMRFMGVMCWWNTTIHIYFQVDATNADYNELFCQIILMFALIVPVLPVSLIHSRTHGVIFISTYRPFIVFLEAIRKHSPSCKFISISSAAVLWQSGSFTGFRVIKG